MTLLQPRAKCFKYSPHLISRRAKVDLHTAEHPGGTSDLWGDALSEPSLQVDVRPAFVAK